MTDGTTKLRVAVSGSFHHHMDAIARAVHALATLSVRVLSPKDPRIVAAQGEFLFVASDCVRSVRLVQDRHLESIRAADFLWLVCPDGYVGASASMEVGFAAAAHVSIFATYPPADLTLREYVNIVPSLSEAVRIAKVSHSPRLVPGLLIDPHASIERIHQTLERIQCSLRCEKTDRVARIYEDVGEIHAHLSLPTALQ